MPYESSRYGTFEDSLDSRQTNLYAIDPNSFDRDTVSEVNLSVNFTQSQDLIVRRQDWLVKNRLPLLYRTILVWVSDKGNLGILLTLHLAILGVFMLTVTEKQSAWRIMAQYMLSCGVLGVAGGMTNWLALKIIFTRIPGVYGTGVFADCSEEIIRIFRKILMNVFLEQPFLEHYVEQKLPQQIVSFNLEGRLRQILDSETMEQMINKELHALSTSAEGHLLLIAGIRTSTIKPLIRPLIMEMVSDILSGKIESLYIENKSDTASLLKDEITRYLESRRGDVHMQEVSKFVKLILYRHLSWLVIVGCAAGLLMGIVSQITEVGKLI